MFENTVRFNHKGERAAIEHSRQSIDSLLIPEHFVASNPDYLAGFLNNQLDTEIEFYIDPALPKYRRGDGFRNDNGDLRGWHQALVDRYGGPVERVLNQQRNLEFEDLSEEELEEVIETQCELQLETIEASGEGKLSQYFEVETELRPRAVTPWYVKIEDVSDLNKNRDIIELAQNFTDAPLKPCVFMELDFAADSANRRAVVQMLDKTGVSEVFLWIEGLGKRAADPMDYVATLDVIHRLSEHGVSPHFFYGNYFAYLTAYFGGHGNCFGVAYQESSSEDTEIGSDSGGGGGGTNRYFFEPVKEFLNFQETESLGQEFDVDLCNCPVCEKTMGSWEDIYIYDGNYTAQRHHYIWNQDRYRKSVQEKELETVLDQLKSAYDRYCDELGGSSTAATPYHLNKWRTGIIHFVEEELKEQTEKIPVPNTQ